MAPKLREVGVRVVTAVIALAIFLFVIWMPGLHVAFAVLVSILVMLGLYELYAITRIRGFSPETIGGMLSGTAIALCGVSGSLTFVNYSFYGGCLLVAALHVVRGHLAVAGLASTIFGVAYVGWFGAHLVLIHGMADIGPGLVTLLFVILIATDTGAYFVGGLIGKRKLAPKVSPNKTWEGAIAGFVCAMLGGWAVYALQQQGTISGFPDWTLPRYLQTAAILSIASQIGDLAESALKRDAGIKDSGSIFPGHGGALDRCDGFLFTSPLLYYMTVPLF
ncbi:MAG: phosphatidate cytidylyltransferase [Phycisphaerae bacterium]|nr:MAG: phosphatidate cytidylyltransferase [Phycisphaerae bacterium]